MYKVRKFVITIVVILLIATMPISVHASSEAYSQQQLVTTALSLVGRVRYVWGGGHQGTSQIIGEVPWWETFNAQFEGNNSIDQAVGVGNHWCPIHGYSDCVFSDTGVYSKEQLEELRSLQFNIEKHQFDIFDTVDWGTNPMYKNVHRFDGLDCSGFMKWVAYQVSSEIYYDGAHNIPLQGNMMPIYDRYNLQSGDIVAWPAHTYMIVGKVEGSTYIHVESTPGTIRLGVTVATPDLTHIEEALGIIEEYYQTKGLVIKDNTRVHKLYSINTYIPETDTWEDQTESVVIGRFYDVVQDCTERSVRNLLGLPDKHILGLPLA